MSPPMKSPASMFVDDYLATSVSMLQKQYVPHNPDYQREIAEDVNSRPDRVRIIFRQYGGVTDAFRLFCEVSGDIFQIFSR
jgi:hypothetical protein